MSKRLVRIAGSPAETQLSALVGQEIHIVLDNGHTHFGRLVSYAHDLLTLRDARGYWHSLPTHEIAEVIFDRVSAY